MAADPRRAALNYRQSRWRRPWARYGIAVGLSGLGLLLSAAIYPVVGYDSTLLVVVVPLVLTAWLGGFGPGIVATGLGTLLATFFFIRPTYSLVITNASDLTRVLLLLVQGVIISAIGRFQNRPSLRRREQLLRQQAELLDQAHDAIVVWDLGGPIRFWNRGAVELYGWSADEAIGQLSHTLLKTHLPLPLREFEALLQRDQRWSGELTHTTRDGRRIITESRLTVVAQDTEPPLILETNRDITARKADEARLQAHSRQLEVLADASRAFAAAGAEYQTVLDMVAQAIAVHLDAGCMIRLVTDDGRWLRIAALFDADTSALDALQVLGAAADVPVGTAHPLAQILEAEQPIVMRNVDPDVRRAPTPPEHQPLIAQFRVHSAVGVPLRVNGRAVGALTVTRHNAAQPHFSDDDLNLVQDLADRAALAIENARLYAQAQAAVRTRDTMLGGVSHDLRNPLSVIDGYTNILRRRLGRAATFDPAAATEIVDKIQHTTRRMSMLIGDLVDSARLEAGYALALHREPADLVQLVSQVVAHYQATTKEHTLQIVAGVDQLSADVDEARLERVLGNLLSNAIKFSPQGGPIDVSVAQVAVAGAPSAVIAVRDQGVGIPPDDLPRLFEHFHRAANVGSITGTGIGLASARHIVEQHGGQIVVESMAGGGSVFTLRLPLAADPSAAG